MSKHGDVLDRDLNLGGIVDYLSMTVGKVDPFPLSGIWIYSGAQGSGKTLNNINLYGIPHEIYTGFECFDKYNNGSKGIVYVIDEIQSLFSSLESKNVPLSQLTVWSQNRKNRRVILGTSQRFSRIQKPIREQCIYHIECRQFLFFKMYRVLDATLYDDDGKYIGDNVIWKPYIPKVEAMLKYNTLEVVQRDQMEGNNVSCKRVDKLS